MLWCSVAAFHTIPKQWFKSNKQTNKKMVIWAGPSPSLHGPCMVSTTRQLDFLHGSKGLPREKVEATVLWRHEPGISTVSYSTGQQGQPRFRGLQGRGTAGRRGMKTNRRVPQEATNEIDMHTVQRLSILYLLLSWLSGSWRGRKSSKGFGRVANYGTLFQCRVIWTRSEKAYELFWVLDSAATWSKSVHIDMTVFY